MPPRTASNLSVATILLAALGGSAGADDAPAIPHPDLTAFTPHKVERVDSDGLLVLEGGDAVKVRLLGVEPPDKASLRGVAFVRFLENLLKGETIRLTNEVTDAADPPDVRRAFVHRDPDGLWVNLEAVRQGYAKVAGGEFEHRAVLLHYEKVAREAGKGVWGPARPADPVAGEGHAARPDEEKPPARPAAEPKRKDAPRTDTSRQTVYVTKTGKKYHQDGCSSLRNSRTATTIRAAKQQGYTPCARCKPPG